LDCKGTRLKRDELIAAQDRREEDLTTFEKVVKSE
jgi:hypothetical protein